MADGVHTGSVRKLAWAPQPGPQTAYVNCPVFEVCYGGARGGGKTSGSLGEWLLHDYEAGQYARGLFIRRKLTDLEDTIEEARNLYEPLGAKWQEQKSQFRFPSGSILRFRYLERDKDADNYQGHQYTRVYVEELTQFASDKPVMKLKGTLRSPHGIRCGMRATCNPGGPGHTWVKARYIDPGAYKIVHEEFTNPFTNEVQKLGRVFIPARLSDNPLLLEADPLYVAKLQQTGSAELVKAWLMGDWNIVEGAFFDGWRPERHEIKPVKIPAHWLRFTSFDFGSAKPFSVGWWAVASDDTRLLTNGGRITLPRGGLVRYREWYGMQPGQPNVGLKLTAEKIAQGILEREQPGESIGYRVADPSIWAEAGGPSIAQRMAAVTVEGKGKVVQKRADNKRVADLGSIGGWDQMRARLEGESLDRPMLVTFETCRDSIRTIPTLQHDPNRAEDLDSNAEDHAADDWRYGCMSRPWIRPAPIVPKRKGDWAERDSDSDDVDWKAA